MYTGVISGIRGAGNGLAANQKPDVWATLGVLEPYNTPLEQYLFFNNKKTKKVVNKRGKFSWMEDELFPHNTTVTAAISSAAPLALTNSNVANIDMFSVGDLVLIEDNDEMGFISAVGTNSASLSHMDGTTALSAVTSGSYLKIMASVSEEDDGARVAMSTKEIEVYNYLTIMKATVYNTNREQAGEAYTDGLTHAEQVHKKMKEMKLQFERLALLSLSAGSNAGNSTLIKSWGKGLQGMITTNISTYTTLTESIFDAWLESFGQKGTPNKSVYAGSDLYFDIQAIIKAKYGTLASDKIVKEYGVDLLKYRHGYLNIDFIRDPVLDGKYTSWAFGIDKDSVIGRYMANDPVGSRKFRIERNVQTPGEDATKTILLSDIGVQLMNEETAGILKK